MLDVVPHSKTLAKLNHPVGVVFPVGGLGDGQVIDPPDFVQVYESMCFANDFQTALYINRGFQANPGEDAFGVEFAQGIDAVIGQRRAAFPLPGESVIQAGQGAGESVPVGPEQINIAQRARSAFCQGAYAQAMRLQDLDCMAGKRGIARVVWVGGETEHHLGVNVCRSILARVFGQIVNKSWAWICASVKFLARHFDHSGHVAVHAFVAATSVWVSGQRRILASLPLGGVDVRASRDTHSVWVDGEIQWPSSKPAIFSHRGYLGGAAGFAALFAEGGGGFKKINLGHLRYPLIYYNPNRLGCQV